MSGLKFQVDDWVQVNDPDPRRAYTSAEIMISVDGIPATRLFDSWSRTVTDRARLPLYPLAEWFAANWWRIHAEAPYEGGGFYPTDWRLSHDLTAIGGGLIWPRMRFASDDQMIQVSARAVRNAPWEPVRHLNDIQPARPVKVEQFDEAVEKIIRLVVLRLNDVGVSAEPLSTIWSNVLEERADPEVAEWRKWEARLGYDPEEAPARLMKQVEALFGIAGAGATAEVAPLLGSESTLSIRMLEALVEAPGIEATLPMRKQHAAHSDLPPWQVGRELANSVRRDMGQQAGALNNSALTALLGIKEDLFTPVTQRNLPMGLGVRTSEGSQAVLHFRKRNQPGLRFEAARFLADSLFAPAEDSWLPLTDRATARQKFQRAFAAELLMPIDEIIELIGETRTSDRFEDVGDQYGVSPLAVRSHLANHGMLRPEEVAVRMG